MTANSLLKTLRAVEEFFDDNGYFPTLEKIAGIIKKTTPTAFSHVRKLEELGLLKKDPTGRISSLCPPPTKGQEGCPKCGAGTGVKNWSHVEADSDGKPNEQVGESLYCKNTDCFYYRNPIEL